MSTIDLKYNVNDKNWVAETYNLSSNHCHLQIGFTSNVAETIFDNLSFGFILKKSGDTIQEEIYPTDGIVYRSSSQPYLISSLLNLEPTTTYVLSAWAENGGHKSTYDFEFTSPQKTETGEYPNSSVPFPDPSNNYADYRFDENLRQWVKK